MNIFQKENVKKSMVWSCDGAYRCNPPIVPTQVTMNYRPDAAGSDTTRPEANRQVLDRPVKANGNPTGEKQQFAQWATGGTKKMHQE